VLNADTDVFFNPVMTRPQPTISPVIRAFVTTGFLAVGLLHELMSPDRQAPWQIGS